MSGVISRKMAATISKLRECIAELMGVHLMIFPSKVVSRHFSSMINDVGDVIAVGRDIVMFGVVM